MQWESKSRYNPASWANDQTCANAQELDLRQGLNALCAQALANVLPVFPNANALNIGQELTPSRAHRKAAVIAEHRLLAAILTNGHCGCLTCLLRLEQRRHATINNFYGQG